MGADAEMTRTVSTERKRAATAAAVAVSVSYVLYSQLGSERVGMGVCVCGSRQLDRRGTNERNERAI